MFSRSVHEAIEKQILSLPEEKQNRAIVRWISFLDSLSGEELESGRDEEVCTPEHRCVDCMAEAMGE